MGEAAQLSDDPLLKQDYRLVPEVATALPAVSRDGKTYTFTIRKGYRFSTGAPVTARNYARAIGRVVNPAMQSPAAEYLREVATAKSAVTPRGLNVTGLCLR